MKNFKYKILPLLVLGACVLSLSVFVSCKNPPLFAAIEDEILLKKFSVAGPIVGFAESGSDVYVATPATIFSKSKLSTGEWSDFGAPEGAALTQQIAFFNGKLFACFYNGGSYYYDSGWKSVPGGKNITGIFGDSTLYGFAGNKVYKVTTAGRTEITPALASGEYLIGASGNYFVTSGKDNAGNDIGKFYSVAGTAATVVQQIGDIRGACVHSTGKILFVTDEKIYHYNGTDLTNISISGKPKSVSYFEGKETVLIGCEKGYTEVKLAPSDANLTGKAVISPGTAGSLTSSSAYNQYTSSIGAYNVSPVFAVDNGSGYSIFAGVMTGKNYKYTGLWGYYSNDKQEWNRE